MAHLIDKDALVAEIEKRIKSVEKRLKRNSSYSEEGVISWGRDKSLYDSYNQFLSFINTLEVKEVDLDKPFEGIKVQTSMESGSLDEVIVTTKYKAQKGEKV